MTAHRGHGWENTILLGNASSQGSAKVLELKSLAQSFLIKSKEAEMQKWIILAYGRM